MADLHLASAGRQIIESKGHAAGLPPKVVRTLKPPIHAVEAGSKTALCGARAHVTDREEWRDGMGRCSTCARLAESA